MTDHTRNTVGVDIAKAHLDAYVAPIGKAAGFSNDAAGFKALIAWVERPVRAVTYEPTGQFHRAFEQALLKAELPLMHALVRDRTAAMNRQKHLLHRLLVAATNFPFVATENCTPLWLAGGALRSSLLTTSTARERGADARMGDEDVAEALPGTGRLEGGVVATLRGESPDDPRVGRDGSVGSGPVGRWLALLAAASGAPQAGSLHGDHRFTSRGVSRAVGAAAV